MYNIIIIRGAFFIDFLSLGTALKIAYPNGVCINNYKLEQMINPKMSTIRSPAYLHLPILECFFIKKYFPIILMGAFSIDEINEISLKYSDSILLTVSLYTTDENLFRKVRNKHNYNFMKTQDFLIKLKSINYLNHQYRDSSIINKEIFETRNQTSFSTDISLDNTKTFIRKIQNFFNN